MSTKTISLSEDAYERLKSLKEENESFSSLVRRLCSGVKLRNFYGILGEEAASELEDAVRESREEHGSRREERVKRLKEDLAD